MSDPKKFTIAGTSIHNGELTYRFASGLPSVRIKTLERTGHTGINLRELPKPMTKEEAVLFLQKTGISAILPKGGRPPKAVEMTPEETAAAARVATATDFSRRLAEAQAGVATAAAFISEQVKAADRAAGVPATRGRKAKVTA